MKDENETPLGFRITRPLAGKIFSFVFCRKTEFFLYTDAVG